MRRNDLNILYVGAALPSRTETFVYREIFALKNRGVNVAAASVHAPVLGLGTRELDELALQAIPIYGDGLGALLRDACVTIARIPWRALRTMSTCLMDAVWGQQVPLSRRPRLFVHCLAGLALVSRLQRRRVQVDCIHAHMAHVPTSIAMYAAATLGVPFSFTGHASDLFREYSLLPAKLRRASFVACISFWHRDFYQRMVADLGSQKLPVIRCGVDCSYFRPEERQPADRTRILTVGRLVEKKGFDVLVAACKRLADAGREFECTIVGDGPEAARLRALIRNQGLNHVVRLVGSKTTAEIRKLMAQASLFVLPCRQARSGDRDGVPVVLMEAMACGLPVVSGDLESIRELIRDGETGLMAEPNDPDDLANRIIELIDDKELQHRLSMQGRQWVVEEFSSPPNIDRLLSALMKATGQVSQPADEAELCQIDTV
jgi:glycosyltransferase involved in cell wall biosynthesis